MGCPMLEALTIVGLGEGQIYITLPLWTKVFSVSRRTMNP